MDLYDDVLADSSQPCESYTSSSETPVESCQELSPKSNSKLTAILYTYNGLCNKRAMVYIGSFVWWTNELKFAENRASSQSKEYAEVAVASENSVHIFPELLPGKILNGDKNEIG
ncbi:hypothetical protein E2320_021539 [Naja naja]|nr:hypothetical protein E2320_021539 [Naja naja]